MVRKFLSDLDNLLEWSSASKAALLLLITAVIHAQYVLWAEYQIENAPLNGNDRFVDVAVLSEQFLQVGWLVYFSGFLALIVFLLRHRYPNARALEHVAAQYFALTMSYFSYLIGNLSLPTGVVIAGAPVCAFILFSRQVVLWAFAVSLIAQGFISWGTMNGWFAYAPVVRSMWLPDGSVSGFWVWNLYAFTLPHLATLVVASYSTLKYWRKREAQVTYLSLTDVLTQLNNRRSIMDTLEKEVARSRRSQLPLTVVLVDLDHFKHINDQLGHSAGDKVLTAAAQSLKHTLRANDHIGRYGGEEFLLILPETRLEDAIHLAERCRHHLEQLPVLLENGVVAHVTGSFGLYCNCLDFNERPEDLLRHADEALYRAKENGRNRIESLPEKG